jgi:hypothetical protein
MRLAERGVGTAAARGRAHLASTTVEAGFQPASDGRILASSPIATGGRDAAFWIFWRSRTPYPGLK